MEGKEESAQNQKPREDKNQHELPEATTEEEGPHQTFPPPSRVDGGNGNRRPPETLPAPEPWYSRFSHTDWITASSAAISALATVVIMIWADLQWYEMHTGGVDTHALADAANEQAYAASKSAQAAKDFANTAALINGGIGDAVQKLEAQVHGSDRANKQTVDLFKLRNRPWVGVEDEVTVEEKGIPWVGEQGHAMVQRMAAENRLPIRVLYHLKNSGIGPALNTMLVIQPITFPQSGSSETQIEASIKKSCEIAEQGITQHNGDLILPGGEHTVPYQFGEWDSTKFVFTPGCIVYRDVDGGIHHTKICYAAAMFLTPKPKILESCQDQSAD